MRKIFVCVMSLFVSMLTACNGSKAYASSEPGSSGTPSYQKISAEKAKEMMDSGRPHVLLDVRSEGEFTTKRIDGALLIPDYEISERATAELPDKSALILIYCRSGRRSAIAARKLIRSGYTNVYDFGGINDWPYATVSGK